MPIYGTPAPVNRFPFVRTFDPKASGASVGTIGANAARFTRIERLPKRIVTTQARVFIGTSSGNFDIAVLTSADGGTTLTRVASTGSTAATPTNDVQSVALAMTWLPDTDYWAVIAADNGTITFMRQLNSATNYTNMLALTKETGSMASAFPVPSSVTATWGYGSAFYILFD